MNAPTQSSTVASAVAEAMPFDITQFGTIDAAETPVEMEFMNPLTKVGSGVFITLVGKDSDAYRALARKLQNKRFVELRKTRTLTMTAEQNEAETVRLLGACVRSWRSRLYERNEEGKLKATENFTATFYDGKNKRHLECNQANVEWVFANVPEIREQVEDFIQDRTNFLSASPTA